MSAPAPGDKPAPVAGGEVIDTASASPAATIDPAEMAEAEAYYSKDNFLRLHKPQFMAMRLPPKLMSVVYAKLLEQQFDADEAFQVELDEDDGYRVVVKNEEGLKAGQDVWVLDHLWTTNLKQGVQQLQEIDGLVDRLWTLADMDRHVGEDRLAASRKAVSSAAAAASGSPVVAAAAPTPAPIVDLDEDVLSTIMSEASVSRDRAVEAYRTNSGDLIQSIVWCGGESERETQVKAQMEKVCEEQAAAQLAQTPAAPVEETPLAELTLEQRIPLLWEGLFKHHLVGSYFTTLQTDVAASTLTDADVQTTIYVNDEIGSAVGQANDAANANAVMSPLVCVTLGGVGFSLLWLTEDLKEGDEVLISRRPDIPLPGVPWPIKK